MDVSSTIPTLCTMAHRKTTRSRRRLKKKNGKVYRIRNWSQYNQSLVARGSITLWISDDAKESWLHRGPKHQGRPFVFSDAAIQCCLTVREVFHLGLRQTQGFVTSVFAMLRIDLPVPDYTTLSRRAEGLDVDLARKIGEGDRMHIVIDSTGLKVYGEGEWKVRKHGWSKHRTWRKFHLAVDPETGEIEAAELTTNGEDDAEQVAPLLRETGAAVESAAMDGAYDVRKVYDLLMEQEIRTLIPPQENAKIWKHGNCAGPPHPRDENLRRIRAIGKARWKQECGYHERSLGETAMYRQKTIFGSHLKNRILKNQRTEARLRCRALNIMTHLGMPRGEWVAAS